jgi:uncharacterized membrane protein YjgN (DUF898 family)
MKYMIIVVPFLRVSGMAIFPFILVSNKAAVNDQTLICHEKIHLRQQTELLIIPFYILYLLNYLINLAAYRKHGQAYLNIAFEREAYQNEANSTYLKNRKWFSWYRYL